MNIKITSLGLAGLLLAAACSNDETQLVECGNEISFNTRVSRATVTTTDNLASFKVWANAKDFTSNSFINGQIATKPEGKSYFTLPQAVFWPQDVAVLDVYALAPAELSATVNSNGPTISDFKPAAATADQVDLVVAYTEAMRSAGTNISLTFKHALSQIEVYATQGVDNTPDSKLVKVKGAWIVNVSDGGTLAFDKTADNYMNWSVNTTKTAYGIEFNSAQALDHTDVALLNDNNKGNMLLVPQQLDTWNLDSEDKAVNTTKGAYILVLCRVEAKHAGTTHPGSDDAIKVDDSNHYHQLFPYTGKFDEAEYGYTCVPVNTKWEPGKKYVYKLSFCGVTSGAGVYPPAADLANLPDGEGKYIKFGVDGGTAFPDGKGVGDSVLDNPITFTVNVETWEGEDDANVVKNDKNMN